MDTNVQVNKQDLRLKDRIDLELSIDPAPPKEEFSGLWFSYTLWYVAFRKKWLQNTVGSYGPLKYVTTSNIDIFCIFNANTSTYQLFELTKHLLA